MLEMCRLCRHRQNMLKKFVAVAAEWRGPPELNYITTQNVRYFALAECGILDKLHVSQTFNF